MRYNKKINIRRDKMKKVALCVLRKQYQSSTCPATKINCAACKACDKSQK